MSRSTFIYEIIMKRMKNYLYELKVKKERWLIYIYNCWIVLIIINNNFNLISFTCSTKDNDHFFYSETVLTSHSIPSWRPRKIREKGVTFFSNGRAGLDIPVSSLNCHQFKFFHYLSKVRKRIIILLQHLERIVSLVYLRKLELVHLTDSLLKGGTQAHLYTLVIYSHLKNQPQILIHLYFHNNFSNKV